MKNLVFGALLFLIFWFYEWLSFLGFALPFDPFFPLLLGGLFWRLKPAVYFLAVFLGGLLIDVFSFRMPGFTVLAYFISLVLFYQFERKLALRGFFPALISLVVTILFCEFLRLWFLPLLFELPLPEPSFYFAGKIAFGTLFWGLICWIFCQFSFMRNVFQISVSKD